MITVKEVFDFLNRRFPVDTACDFDNVGLLIGDETAAVTKALVALDCTEAVLKLAITKHCELIVTHHPVIFKPLKTVTADSLVWRLVQNGISVISMHTNLDMGTGGVNDSLCTALGLDNVQKVQAEDGFLLNAGTLSPAKSADELARHIKARLGGAVKYVGRAEPIKRVLICSGSGGDYLSLAADRHYDALITADVKHHLFLEAEQVGVALFDAGHFDTEDVVVEPLTHLLQEQFPTVSFAEDHTSQIQHL